MRVSVIVAALAVVNVASARFLNKRQPPPPPKCAMSCLMGNTGPCSSTDVACLCKDSAFVEAAKKCLEDNCQGNDLTEAIQHACAECANANAPLPDTICKATTA